MTPTEAAPVKKARKVRSKEKLAAEIDRQLLEQAPEMLQKKWVALGKALDKGERWAVELIARQFEGDRGPGGINIVSQTLNVAAAEQATAARSLESIILKLEARDQFKALPAPTEIRRATRPDLDTEIIDAETD